MSSIVIRHGANDGGELYEFRHEQMQVYLAARWAVVHAPSPVLRLEEEAVWLLSTSGQDQLFAFAAELTAARGTPTELGNSSSSRKRGLWNGAGYKGP